MQKLARMLGIDARLRELLNNSALTFAGKVAAAGAGFLLNLLLARQMGAEQFGYSYVLTVVAVLSSLACLGMNSAAIRFIASYRIEGRWATARSSQSRPSERAAPVRR